ncbi:MAG: redoxin domain-containing protein [Fimbriimonadaceae bacterium]
MKTKRAILALSIGAAALLMLGNAPVGGAEIGKAAPAFTAVDSNGKTVNLADFKGKIVVLEWTNDGCPYVVANYQGNMQALQKKYTEKGVVWLSIISSKPGTQGYADGARANELTKSRSAVPSRVLLDPKGEVGKLYAAKVTPHMFVIDKDGVLRYDGAINAKPSSRATDHKPEESYVTFAVDAIMAGKEVATTKTQPYGCGIKY